MALFW